MSFDEFKKYITNKINSDLESIASRIQNFENKAVPVLKKKLEGVKLKAGKWGKGVLIITLTGAILVSSIIASNSNKKDGDVSTPAVVSTELANTNKPNPSPSTKEEPDVYIDTFNGQDYYFCSQDYVYELASQALTNCENMLTAIDGVTDMGDDGFYQEFFNEDMLAAITFTESTNRIKHKDGSPLKSNTGALGMCQLEPICIDTINQWLRNTMNIYDKTYTYEDANDPLKSLEMATLALIRVCKNETRPNDVNYTNMGVPFSRELQEKLLYAIYFYGEGNVQRACKDKSIFDTYLNPDWRDKNGANYVYDVLRNKQMLISQRKNQNNNYAMEQ